MGILDNFYTNLMQRQGRLTSGINVGGRKYSSANTWQPAAAGTSVYTGMRNYGAVNESPTDIALKQEQAPETTSSGATILASLQQTHGAASSPAEDLANVSNKNLALLSKQNEPSENLLSKQNKPSENLQNVQLASKGLGTVSALDRLALDGTALGQAAGQAAGVLGMGASAYTALKGKTEAERRSGYTGLGTQAVLTGAKSFAAEEAAKYAASAAAQEAAGEFGANAAGSAATTYGGSALGGAASALTSVTAYAPYVALAKLVGTGTRMVTGDTDPNAPNNGYMSRAGRVAEKADLGVFKPVADEIGVGKGSQFETYSENAFSFLNPAGSILSDINTGDYGHIAKDIGVASAPIVIGGTLPAVAGTAIAASPAALAAVLVDAFNKINNRDIGGALASVATGGLSTVVSKVFGTVVCTELKNQGKISKEVWIADGKFGKYVMDINEYNWYLTWGIPTAEKMKRSKIFSYFVSFFMTPVSKYMAGEMGVGSGSLFGKFNFKMLQLVHKVTRRVRNARRLLQTTSDS